MNMSFPGLVICCNDVFLALWFSLGPGRNPCAQTEGCPGSFQAASLKGNSGKKRMDRAVVLGKR